MLEIAFSAQRSVVKAIPYFLRESWRFLMLTPLFLGWDTETHKHEMTFPKIMHSSPLHCTPPTWRWVPSGISCILMTSAFMLCKFHYLTMLGRFPVFKWIWWNAWAFGLTPLRVHLKLQYSPTTKTAAVVAQPSNGTLSVLSLALAPPALLSSDTNFAKHTWTCIFSIHLSVYPITTPHDTAHPQLVSRW